MKTKYSVRYLPLISIVLFISCSSTNAVRSEKSWIDLGSIPYGADENQYVEITAPKYNNQNVNVIFFVHGYGNRMADPVFLEKYRENYIIGKLDYRFLTPARTDLSMDELLSDVHNGLRTLKDSAEAKGIKLNKVIMIGNSFGAALSLMYSYTFLDKTPIPIAFCVALAGITDVSDTMVIHYIKHAGSKRILRYFLASVSILSKETLSINDVTELGFSGNAIEAVKKISPIYYVNESVPPAIILHDTGDILVPFSNAASLSHVLNAYNVPNIFIQSVTSSGHILGTNVRNKNDLVFAPAADARLPASSPKRYTRQLHPLLEEKLLESIDKFIDQFID